MIYRNVRQVTDSFRLFSRATGLFGTSILISLFALLPLAPATVSATTDKPQPVKSAESTNGVTAPVPGKATANPAPPAPAPYLVSLAASSTYLWPKQFSTLTAATNQNVGPTPYYLSIYDATAHSYVKICSTGTVCSVAVTQQMATSHTYRAYVSLYPSTNPPAGQQAVSANRTVTWRGVSVSLKASPTTVSLGASSKLTATASADVGPSPFYIQIFDATTSTRIAVCGFGTTCAVNRTYAVSTTHRYVAYVSDSSAAYPPTGRQATSNWSFVTWTNTGYRVSLSATTPSTGKRTLKASTNINVGPTPYSIQIFNLRTNSRVAICSSGTTCSVTVSLAFGKTDWVAFVSSNSTSIPPLNTRASSSLVSAVYYPIIVAPSP